MIWNLLAILALLFIMIVMVARANDLRWKRTWYYQLRLVSFAVVMAMAVPVIVVRWGTPVAPPEVFFLLGLCGVFFTTQQQVPFWRWLAKGENSDGY